MADERQLDRELEHARRNRQQQQQTEERRRRERVSREPRSSKDAKST